MTLEPDPFESALGRDVVAKARYGWGDLGRQVQRREDWIGNFDQSHYQIALRLLLHFRHYPLDELPYLCDALMLHRLRPHLLRRVEATGAVLNSDDAVKHFEQLCRSTWIVPMRDIRPSKRPEVESSSGDLVQGVCRDHRLGGTNDARDYDAIPEQAAIGTLVILDDFLGTGNQALRYVRHVRSTPRYADQEFEIVICAFAAMRRGIKRLQTKLGVSVLAVDEYGGEHEAFGAESTAFPDPADRLAAREIINSYGVRLYKRWPLGFGHSMMLVGFGERSPNNTLPVIWSEAGGWKYLVPRR